MLFLDEVPPVYVPSKNVCSWRGLIEYRRRLIGKRTRTKNALRAILRTVGLRPPHEFGLWTHPGVMWLAKAELPQLIALQRDLLLEELAMFQSQVQRAEKELERF